MHALPAAILYIIIAIAISGLKKVPVCIMDLRVGGKGDSAISVALVGDITPQQYVQKVINEYQALGRREV